MKKIGIIGYGSRMSSLVHHLLKYDDICEISAIADPNPDVAKNHLTEYKQDLSKINFYADGVEMLNAEKLDAVMIGTRCSLHTDMAVEVIKRGLYLFLEKPVSINEEQLFVLEEAVKKYNASDKIVVSFPLRISDMCQKVKELIDAGVIGKVEHVVAINYPFYARGYYHKWYRSAEETGGLFLQKATHDLDYINYLVGEKPVRVCAMKSKQIFKGDKPADLKCANCKDRETCPESDINVISYGGEPKPGELCCYSSANGLEDSGTVIVEYESGMHAVYTQDFIARKKAGARGARLFGYKGTIEFDWTRSFLKIYYHNEDRVEEINLEKEVGHDVGDSRLIKNFTDMICNGAKPGATIEEGCLSAKMCILAKKSSENHEFYEL